MSAKKLSGDNQVDSVNNGLLALIDTDISKIFHNNQYLKREYYYYGIFIHVSFGIFEIMEYILVFIVN